ncbi:MAG TPA: 4-hydroxy-tetrahydrodipicolinate reductase [Candidatus Kapabacteria bacterium]|jgi:4-hydroxy-tetrahydrodipicolinate reductase
MNIALFGYGKMGHEVEQAAIAAGHAIVIAFDVDSPATRSALRESGADVVIDFSQASGVEEHVRLCAETKIPIVIGTTGWEQTLGTVRGIVEQAKIGCIAGSNFSIGVNLFLRIVRDAAKMLDAAGYDAYILEAHHRAKKDFPSGTALRLGEAVLQSMASKAKIASELTQGEAIAKETLLISSIRAGALTGTHLVGFDAEDDAIELTHRAKSRRGFATGSIKAAEWIIGKNGFYRFEENIEKILSR